MSKIIFFFIDIIIVLSVLLSCNAAIDMGSDVPSNSSPVETKAPDTKTQPTAKQPVPTTDTSHIKNDGAVIISEAMIDNELYYAQGYYDWVELYNPSDSAVDLSGYYLSDESTNLKKNRLPQVTLASGEYTVILCDGVTVSMALSKSGGQILLSDESGALVSAISYTPVNKNLSVLTDGTVCAYPTPGFENSMEGYSKYRQSLKSDLCINEVIASNSSYYPVNGEYYDLIELKNCSSSAVELADYYLSDSFDTLKKWNIPSKTLAPGELYVVVASGNGGGEANFKISGSGETLFLTKSNGEYIDAIRIENVPHNKSCGRNNSELVLFDSPTIGAENSTASTVTALPVPSTAGGVYASPVTVSFTGSNVYYTLDGSKPSQNSTKYQSAINISSTSTLRVIAYEDGKQPSDILTCSYFIGVDHKLPILKVTSAPGDVLGSGGIYENYSNATEKEINLALYVGGTEEFSVNCGINMFGSSGREEAKKSFKVKFRGKYGASKLHYKVFENLDIDEFDSLVIRGGSQDWYFSGIRDELMTSLAGDGMSDTLLTQAYRATVLYINNEYYGIYFLRERIDEDFVASHLGGNEDNAAIIRYGYALEKGTQQDKQDWNELISFIKSKDMTDSANYAYVCERLDVESLADWFIARGYAGDRDVDNIRYCRAEGGKWKLIFFDLDLGFWGTKSPLTKIMGSASEYNVPIYYLKKSPEFRDMFLKRLAKHLKTTFSDETALAKIDALESLLAADITANQARWESSYIAEGKGSYFTYNFWTSQLNYLRSIINKNGTSRTEELINDAVSLFNLSASERQTYF